MFSEPRSPPYLGSSSFSGDVVFNEMEASFAGLQRKYTVLRPAGRATNGHVAESVDLLVRMGMADRGEKADIPRQACVLPGDYAEPDGLSDELRKPEVWTKKFKEWCESDFKAGKSVWKKKV